MSAGGYYNLRQKIIRQQDHKIKNLKQKDRADLKTLKLINTDGNLISRSSSVMTQEMTTGPQGATGPQGSPGSAGSDGTNGYNGADGAQGPTGTQGATGVANVVSTGFTLVADSSSDFTDLNYAVWSDGESISGLYIGDNNGAISGSGLRSARFTEQVNLLNGTQFIQDMTLGTNAINGLAMEIADTGEEIYIQYSLNNTDWTDIGVIPHNSLVYNTATTITVTYTGSDIGYCYIRYVQKTHSGTGFDTHFLSNISVELQEQLCSGIITGRGVLNGSSGVTIIDSRLGSTSKVFVNHIEPSDTGVMGVLFVSNIDTNQFVVKSLNASDTNTFHWMALNHPNLIP